jgi:mono/diheme cytochrome c family protein
MNVYVKKAVILMGGTVAAILVAGTLSLSVSAPAKATPQYAADTKKACGVCHQNPAGGGALKPLGEKFKANGHKL